MPQRHDSRDQTFLLPPSLDEWTPNDHPVRFADAFVDSLPAATRQTLGLDARPHQHGAPRYAPMVLLRVWVYGFMSQRRSSRALERACRDEIALRWLTGNQCPDHNTLWRWYVAHRSAMHALFTQSVRTAVQAGLVDLALMAVDGTKVVANAAADRSLTEEDLTKLLAQTEQAIADLEAQNVVGDDPVPPSLPPDLRSAEALRARIRAALEECAKRAAPTGRSASVKAPRGNVTDPQARWMKTRKGIVPGYNAQLAVVATNARAQSILGRALPAGRIVVAAQVSTQPTDVTLLAPMVRAACETLGVVPGVTVADAGYFDGGQLAAVAALGAVVVVSESTDEPTTNPYHRAAFVYDGNADQLRCPEGHVLSLQGMSQVATGEPTRRYGGLAATCPGCPAFGSCTNDAKRGRTVKLTAYDDAIQAQRRARERAIPRIVRRRRKALIEAVFGTMKTTLGGARTTVRGLAKVEAEWSALALAMNLRTLHRIWQALPEDRRWNVLEVPRSA